MEKHLTEKINTNKDQWELQAKNIKGHGKKQAKAVKFLQFYEEPIQSVKYFISKEKKN